MQFYALDEKKKLTFARHAKKNETYFCLECRLRLRLRGGEKRQLHFYHPRRLSPCKIKARSQIHLQVQHFIAKQLPIHDFQLEYHFPSIRRIADVAWLSKKIVFEVQCSPISSQEVEKRNADYHKEGWSVIWILHDQRYNQPVLSSMEKFLQTNPHYFTDINKKGKGSIYDQLQLVENNFRSFKSQKFNLDISQIFETKNYEIMAHDLLVCQNRKKNWRYFFRGDLMSIKDSIDYHKILAIEKELLRKQRKKIVKSILSKSFHFLVLRPYRIFFNYLLEKTCY